MAMPPPIVSSKYFDVVFEAARMNLIPDWAATSVNVTGERACGPGGGGVFGKSGMEYDRPVRSGVGVGEGCCAVA